MKKAFKRGMKLLGAEVGLLGAVYFPMVTACTPLNVILWVNALVLMVASAVALCVDLSE